jgi:hypothetical protein
MASENQRPRNGVMERHGDLQLMTGLQVILAARQLVYEGQLTHGIDADSDYADLDWTRTLSA